MRLAILGDDEQVLWAISDSNGKLGGITAARYATDGTLEKIVAIIERARAQASFESGVFHDVDRVPDICLTASEINGDVPVSG